MVAGQPPPVEAGADRDVHQAGHRQSKAPRTIANLPDPSHKVYQGNRLLSSGSETIVRIFGPSLLRMHYLNREHQSLLCDASYLDYDLVAQKVASILSPPPPHVWR